MKHFLKGLLGLSLVPLVMIGCTSSPSKQGHTTPSGKRIFIPQERISIERTTAPKTVPYTYNAWMATSNNLRQVREYEMFLDRNGVGNIIPSFELMRTARDWQKCARSQYMIPNQELWNNQVSTLRVFKYLIAAKVLTDFEVTSVYRDLPSINVLAALTHRVIYLIQPSIFALGRLIHKPMTMPLLKAVNLNYANFGRNMVKA